LSYYIAYLLETINELSVFGYNAFGINEVKKTLKHWARQKNSNIYALGHRDHNYIAIANIIENNIGMLRLL